MCTCTAAQLVVLTVFHRNIKLFREEMAKEMSDLLARWVENKQPVRLFQSTQTKCLPVC